MRTLIVLFFTLSSITVYAQTESGQYSQFLEETSAAEAGMSAERLSHIDDMLQHAVTSNQIPGAVALVARNGKIVYHKAFGIVNNQGETEGGRGSTGTFDWGGYFNTQYFADPQEKVIGILFKQTRGPTGDQTAWKFRQLVGQAIDD
jgi:CubicO group peptidase (beta-lactamase class C family)